MARRVVIVEGKSGEPISRAGLRVDRVFLAVAAVVLVASLSVAVLEVVTHGAWRLGSGDAATDSLPAAETSTSPLLSLRFVASVDDVAGSIVGFRPVGGARLGDEAVLIDAGSGRLLFVAPDGALREVPLASPDVPGAVAPRFTALVTTSTGIFVVADLANGTLWRYGTDGRFLGAFLSEEEHSIAALTKPTSLTVDGSGNLLVADSGDQTIKVFNKAGTLLLSMRGDESTGGGLDHPNGVAVDAEGSVYVADSNNRRIVVFDKTGSPSSVIGVGQGSPALLLPRSLGVDSRGRIHVVDSFLGVVRVFAKDGSFLGSYGADTGSGEGLILPEGLVMVEGSVVVGDRGNGRLAVFAE